MKFSSQYLITLHPDQLIRSVTRVASNLKSLQEEIKFDAIAFRGMSGASMAYPVSFLTGIPLLQIRKMTEKSHGNNVEGSGDIIRKYIILDDFIFSGETVRSIITEINKEARRLATFQYSQPEMVKPPECIGITLYTGIDPDNKSFYRCGAAEMESFDGIRKYLV